MKKSSSVPAVLLLAVVVARPHLSGSAYPFVQGIFLVPALVALGLVLLSPSGKSGSERALKGLPVLLPWMLCIWSLASIFWSTDAGRGLEESFALLLNITVFTLVYALWPREKTDERFWIGGFFVLLLPVIIRGAFQYVFGLTRLRQLLSGMSADGQNIVDLMRIVSDDRIFAGFLNPNMLAGFLAIVIPVTLDLALTSRTRFAQLASGSLVAGQFGVLLLTGSMGGSLAAAGASCAVLLLRRGVRRRDLFWMGSVGVMILAGLAIMRGVDLSVGPDHSVVQRFGYMKAGVLMALANPFLGWGAGAGPGALMAYVPEGIRPVIDPHNFLVRSWISWGVPGAVILITFLFLWIVKVSRPMMEGNRSGGPQYHVGLVFGGFAFLLHSLIDMDFFVPETAMFGWAILGACLASALDSEKMEQGSAVSSNALFLRMMGGIALALVIPSMVYAQGEFTGFRAAKALEAGRTGESANLYAQARSLLPFHGRFALDEGRVRRASGQMPEAQELFEKASVLIPSSPYPQWELGRTAQQEEEWERSITYLESALMKYPTSPRIRIDLAQAFYQLGDYEETIRLLVEVRRFAVFDPEARAVALNALDRPATVGSSTAIHSQ